MVWKRGCQPFSWPHSQNGMHCRKKICSTCLLKESIPAITFGNSKLPLPTKSFLRAAARSALWLHRARPFIAATGKNLSHAEKQRVWSRSCGFQNFLQCCDCALSCAVRLLQTNEQLSRLSFLAQWDGSGAASLSAAHVRKMRRTAEKRFVGHVCLRNPFPPFLFGIPSIHSLPEAGFESFSTFHHLCILATSCPSLRSSCRKNPSHAERQRDWSRNCGLQDLLQCSDCALSCAM